MRITTSLLLSVLVFLTIQPIAAHSIPQLGKRTPGKAGGDSKSGKPADTGVGPVNPTKAKREGGSANDGPSDAKKSGKKRKQEEEEIEISSNDDDDELEDGEIVEARQPKSRKEKVPVIDLRDVDDEGNPYPQADVPMEEDPQPKEKKTKEPKKNQKPQPSMADESAGIAQDDTPRRSARLNAPKSAEGGSSRQGPPGTTLTPTSRGGRKSGNMGGLEGSGRSGSPATSKNAKKKIDKLGQPRQPRQPGQPGQSGRKGSKKQKMQKRATIPSYRNS